MYASWHGVFPDLELLIYEVPTYLIFVFVLIAQIRETLFAGFLMTVVSPTQAYSANLNKRICCRQRIGEQNKDM